MHKKGTEKHTTYSYVRKQACTWFFFLSCCELYISFHNGSSWTKRLLQVSLLVLSTERMVRSNENKGQSNPFKSGVPMHQPEPLL